MTCGIYEIVHVASGRLYIGSAVNIEYRCERQHRPDLDMTGVRHHNAPLQNAWNKHGCDEFRFGIIEECDEWCLLDREQFYIDSTPKERLFNVASIVGRPPSHKGRKHSGEHSRRISEARMGHHVSRETREKISRSNRVNGNRPPSQKGKKLAPWTDERREKMVAARGGRPRTAAQIAVSEFHRGKKRSEETRQRQRDAWVRRKLRKAELREI